MLRPSSFIFWLFVCVVVVMLVVVLVLLLSKIIIINKIILVVVSYYLFCEYSNSMLSSQILGRYSNFI